MAARFFLAQTTILAVLWFLYAGQVTTSEIAVGVGGVAVTLAFVARIHHIRLADFSPRGSWLLQAVHLPWQVVRDTATVLGPLWQRVTNGTDAPGTLKVTPFPSKNNTPREAARRALVVAFTSLPPNSVVIGVDREKDLLLYHELVPQPKVPDTITALESE